ncbi:MAG: RAD55 family ATPase [Thaumarchaeota archaeon]|nr:RAD55 family ATPase [Nitrososphaerota archaeon]
MIERLRIGIQELDQMLLGGIPKGSLCLLLGPPGAGKSILSRRFLYTGILDGKDGFLISTAENEETARETMRLFNWDKGIDSKLHVLDCYSWKTGVSNSKGVEKAGSARVVLDSFTDAIIYGGADRALKFLDSIHTKLESRGITGLLLLEEGVHDAQTVTSVEYTTNGTIRMKFSEQGRFMMVSRMTGTPLSPRWMPFAIGK